MGPQRRDLDIDTFKQALLLGVAPRNAVGKGLGKRSGFFGAGKGLVDLERGRNLPVRFAKSGIWLS